MWVVKIAKHQRFGRTSVNTSRLESFLQTRLLAKITLVDGFGLRVYIAHLIRTSGNTVLTPNAFELIDSNDSGIWVSIGGACGAHSDTRGVFTVLTTDPLKPIERRIPTAIWAGSANAQPRHRLRYLVGLAAGL
ncbi:hypothetical protein GCM10007895_07390 [Paraferrimonas sedimenticola]|uniref:Uncharacterized protein n=1 Tax=Paraferrimonas sedimenticola TaxID=375674 RepID=A0AA37RUK5_9GAMM|nr:hypothetical protein GCM10007895_07390 [Paraferrimonas sedimenticola]